MQKDFILKSVGGGTVFPLVSLDSGGGGSGGRAGGGGEKPSAWWCYSLWSKQEATRRSGPPALCVVRSAAVRILSDTRTFVRVEPPDGRSSHINWKLCVRPHYFFNDSTPKTDHRWVHTLRMLRCVWSRSEEFTPNPVHQPVSAEYGVP